MFEVLTAREARSVDVWGEPTTEHTWFSGYAWRALVCASCLSHLGWRFDSVSGAEPAYRKVEDVIQAFSPAGVSYVGEGELARICKIAHNVMLGVVIENLIDDDFVRKLDANGATIGVYTKVVRDYFGPGEGSNFLFTHTPSGSNVKQVKANALYIDIDQAEHGDLAPGHKAQRLEAAGTLGIVLGGPIVYLVFGSLLPEEAWKGLAALSGSWIGGTANMVAIAESVGTPDAVMGPVIVVDTVVGYSWTGVLLFFSGWQRFNEAFGIVPDSWRDGDPRPEGRHVQPAVGGKARQQNVVKPELRGSASGRDITQGKRPFRLRKRRILRGAWDGLNPPKSSGNRA